MFSIKRALTATCVLAIANSFVGAGPPATAASHSATPSGSEADGPVHPDCPEEDRGGTVDFAVLVEAIGFDPTMSGSVGIQGGSERIAVYDALMQFDPETNEFKGRMAESLVANDELTEWTLTLRDGITFASGNPLTTAAVAFSVDRHRADDTTSIWKPQADLIESMDIVDDLTMTFHLSDPWGDFPALLSGAVGMVYDPAVFEELGVEAFGSDPGDAGAGPYRVDRYAPGEEMVLVARDDYWAGRACIDELRFALVGNEDTRTEAFLADEYDIAFFQTSPAFAELRDAGFEPQTTVVNGTDSLLINHGAGGVARPGSDLRVRQALAHALDVDLIDQRVTGGVGMPTRGLVGEDSPLWSPGIAGPEYDPDLARQYLAEAKADGFDGRLTLTCHNAPPLVEWALTVKGLLESVGFTIEVDNSRTLGDQIGLIYGGNYEIACFTLAMEEYAPWMTLVPRIGRDPVTLSRSGYDSPRMEVAMDALRSAATLEDRQAALVQVQDVWNEEVPQVLTNGSWRGVAAHDRLEGLEYTSTATVLFDRARLVD